MAKFLFPSAHREQTIVVVYHVPMQMHVIIRDAIFLYRRTLRLIYTQEKLIEPQGFKGFCARIPLKCAQHCRRRMQYLYIAVNQITRVSRVMPSPRTIRLQETSEHCWLYDVVLYEYFYEYRYMSRLRAHMKLNLKQRSFMFIVRVTLSAKKMHRPTLCTRARERYMCYGDYICITTMLIPEALYIMFS